jgi:menaquinone-dependent protoporphyrinogen oxidase
MSRLLVVYASHYGQTRTIAEHIVERLQRQGHDVTLANAEGSIKAPPPHAFDAVILGSRIEFGQHSPAILAYVREHRRALCAVPTGFFSVSMAAATSTRRDPNGYLVKTFGQLRWAPNESVAFGGALPYTRYGLILRFVMKQLSKRGGHTTDTSRDHVFTDFAAVSTFADRVAALLGTRRSNTAATWTAARATQ